MPPKGKGKTTNGKGKGKAKAEPASKKKEVDHDDGKAKKPPAKLQKQEKDVKINAIVRYMLFASTNARPVKVDGIVKDVLSTIDEGHHYDLIQGAARKLEKVFGLRVALLPAPDTGAIAEKLYKSESESDDDDDAGEAAGSQRKGKGKNAAKERYRRADTLVLLNIIKRKTRAEAGFEPRSVEKWGVCMSVLAFVYVSGMEVTETALSQFLRDLEIDWSKHKHRDLGATGSALVADFVQQRYLYRKQGEQTGDAREYLYRWGPRARTELTEGDVISFLADVYGKKTSSWHDQLIVGRSKAIVGLDVDDMDEG